MANPTLARQKQQAIDELIHAIAMEDLAKVMFPDNETLQQDYKKHMRKKMPQCFKTLDFFKNHYPKVMRNLRKEFEENWPDE